jgi:hypothetical protein
VALNPQKLAGQCGKLKCCLNYELPGYEDARKQFPDPEPPLKTSRGDALHMKTDVYRSLMWFGYTGTGAQTLVAVPVERVVEIRKMNTQGKVPDDLIDNVSVPSAVPLDYTNGAGEESLTRFERDVPKKRKKQRRGRRSQR